MSTWPWRRRVPALVGQALASCTKTGQVVIVGAAPHGASIDIDWWALAAGRTLKGSVIGGSNPVVAIPRLIRLWESGRLPLNQMVTTYPFSAVNEAIADLANGKSLKPVLLFGEQRIDGGQRKDPGRQLSSQLRPNNSYRASWGRNGIATCQPTVEPGEGRDRGLGYALTLNPTSRIQFLGRDQCPRRASEASSDQVSLLMSTAGASRPAPGVRYRTESPCAARDRAPG